MSEKQVVEPEPVPPLPELPVEKPVVEPQPEPSAPEQPASELQTPVLAAIEVGAAARIEEDEELSYEQLDNVCTDRKLIDRKLIDR